MQMLRDFFSHQFVSGVLSAVVVFFVIPWAWEKYRNRKRILIAEVNDTQRFAELPIVSLLKDKRDGNVIIELHVILQEGGARHVIPASQASNFIAIMESHVSFGKNYPLSHVPKKGVNENIKQTGLNYALGLKEIMPLTLFSYTDRNDSEVFVCFTHEGFMIPLKVFEQWVVALKSLFQAYGIIPTEEQPHVPLAL